MLAIGASAFDPTADGLQLVCNSRGRQIFIALKDGGEGDRPEWPITKATSPSRRARHPRTLRAGMKDNLARACDRLNKLEAKIAGEDDRTRRAKLDKAADKLAMRLRKWRVFLASPLARRIRLLRKTDRSPARWQPARHAFVRLRP
jgi:hypothetical protein